MPENGRAGERDSRGRFVAGSSPNPKGRPRKATEKAESQLDVLLSKSVTVTAPDGSLRGVSASEAVELRTLRDALDGRAGPIARVTKWLIKRERWFRKKYEEKAARISEMTPVTPPRSYSDPENADEALQLLGIASRDAAYEESVNRPGYVHLRLEPWAVQAALKRRRSPEPFSKAEITNIEACSWHPEAIDWPEGSRW